MRKLISLFLCLCLAAGFAPALAEGTEADAGAQQDMASIMQAITGQGIVNTFIGEKFSDRKIEGLEDALECIKEVYDRIGADETTELVPQSVRPNANGMTVITFSQRVGAVMAYGAAVKLILNGDDEPIGLVSSIMPNVKIRPVEEWAVDSEKAEQIVMDMLKEIGSTDTLVEGATQAAVIPLMAGRYSCVYIVYTFQMDKDHDGQAYTAHYVEVDGHYLYSTPASEPGDADVADGQNAKSIFDFDAYEPDEMEVTLQLHDGTKIVKVPVLKDPESGKVYLADAERKILCGEHPPYALEGMKIVPLEVQDGVNPYDANVYYTYMRVYDYYKKVGWSGPDGYGTPTLLLMGFVDAEGKPFENACYITKDQGFQVFAWTRLTNFGECVDIVAHEYTHCVTTATMTYNIYQNDPGAINEAFSDIMGNLIEMRLNGEDGAWLIGENVMLIRNMADPHQFTQPAYAWDAYYAPKPPVVTGANDQGGVHINASLLSMVSYRLDQAGMSPRDQSYFWLNTAIVISPQTDYPMLADILPWVMTQLGYTQFIDTVTDATEEMRFRATEDPGIVPEGFGTVTFDFAPVEAAASSGRVCVSFYPAPDADPMKRADTWPIAGTTVARAYVAEGEYYVVASITDATGMIKRSAVLGPDGWVRIEDREAETVKANGRTIPIPAGEVTEVPNDHFAEPATEILNEFDLADEPAAAGG